MQSNIAFNPKIRKLHKVSVRPTAGFQLVLSCGICMDFEICPGFAANQ